MKKLITLAVGTILLVWLLGAGVASAWTVRGNVYISGTKPLPCALMELYDQADCTGFLLDWTLTDVNGYFALNNAEGDTVWVKMIFDPETTCEYCTDWFDCTADTQCQMAISSDPGPVIFNLNQPDCNCQHP